ncbi:type II toxin-antitoxin system VapC family toxin [Geochorda subterranea]|uniref:Type II toxin-antitoxin system VapC family toxin n=1 Tax=Geochorda subterranea TaxID=3109564 RepID=A0ABZ1BSA8_9FIRM|nr:type II toxin-antitoxin system VapC family toxin [Limnochorda sp. LNt]WRP15686.1 type II toxin-antitoxin system VapC family toxin [Limnochorda sp. LNt]
MIVLDTHAWVWWVSSPDQLSPKAREAADQAVEAGALYISSISVWEVVLLVQRDRLRLTLGVEDWVAYCEALPFIRFVPVNNAIAMKSVRLPGSLHPDPADRIIIATALTIGAPLVTKDHRIRSYPHVETIW